jgi:hypothetical protein
MHKQNIDAGHGWATTQIKPPETQVKESVKTSWCNLQFGPFQDANLQQMQSSALPCARGHSS